jgi:hypothetical protein
MGRMKELCIDIMNANNGKLPEKITSGDVARMKQLEIYNWEEYEKKIKTEIIIDETFKGKHFEIKTDARSEKTEEEPF